MSSMDCNESVVKMTDNLDRNTVRNEPNIQCQQNLREVSLN